MLTNSQSKVICNEDKRNTAYNTILSQVSNLIEENGIKDVSLSESLNRTTVTFRIEDRSNNITSLKVQRNKTDKTLPIYIIDSKGKKHVRIFDNNTWKVWNSLIDDVTSRTASDKLYNDQGFLNSILPTLNKVLSFYRENKCINLSNASKSTTSTPAPETTEKQAILNTDQEWQKTDLDRIMSESTTSTPDSKTTDEEAKEIWETAQVLQKTDFNGSNNVLEKFREYNEHHIGLTNHTAVDRTNHTANVTNTIRTSSFNPFGINGREIEKKPILPAIGITWSIPATSWAVIGGVTGGIAGILAVGLIGKAAYRWYTSDQYVAVSTKVTDPSADEAEKGIALNQ